ncbi:MAG: hypothetical protein M3096_04610 [Actinomycetia bacterium]|nr:hypothetical protein [Actinomycetes bacterium]
MTTAQDDTAIDRKVRGALPSPSVRKHMLIVGAALSTVGGLTFWLLPELSLRWVVVAVIIVTHIGLLMVIGAAVLGWLAPRKRGG